jgi:hypothetical protein
VKDDITELSNEDMEVVKQMVGEEEMGMVKGEKMEKEEGSHGEKDKKEKEGGEEKYKLDVEDFSVVMAKDTDIFCRGIVDHAGMNVFFFLNFF